MEIPPIITANDLQDMRSAANKDSHRMSKYAGVKTKKTYENWESGKGSPSMNQFIAMALKCGFEPHSLVDMYLSRMSVSESVDYESARRKD